VQESEGADEDGVVWMTDTSAEAAKQRAQVRDIFTFAFDVPLVCR
jgi:hypothetical protein